MRVRKLEIENFRGITEGRVVFQQHTLLVGGTTSASPRCAKRWRWSWGQSASTADRSSTSTTSPSVTESPRVS